MASGILSCDVRFCGDYLHPLNPICKKGHPRVCREGLQEKTKQSMLYSNGGGGGGGKEEKGIRVNKKIKGICSYLFMGHRSHQNCHH